MPDAPECRSSPGPRYEPAVLEPRWQERWREGRVFEAHPDPARPKYFCYNPAPYVTGSLHMGHVRNYACGDFIAKYMKLRGAAVLYTLGFDAYGLPTEMAAIRNSLDPERWTADCLGEMKRQLVALGCGFDWRRSFVTSDPAYYRWTQWLFLKLLEKDLIYTAIGSAFWCPRCETTLARTQVEEDACWICATPVERREVREWRLRLSAYLGDLLVGLEEMRDLNGLADLGQKNLISPRVGLKVELLLANGQRIDAFMESREDWPSNCVLAVHARDEATLRLLRVGLAAVSTSPPGADLRESDGATQPDGGFAPFVGMTAIEPRSRREFPVVISGTLDSAYLDRPVVVPLERALREPPPGVAHPAVFPGAAAPDFPPLTIYRQKDFSISRQRLWGTPSPIVLCEECGAVAVPDEELPVLAPKIVFDPATRRLKREDPDWDLRACPRCAKPARLDPQVMDCHMDSLWHPFRPCAGEENAFLFDPEEMRYWMPADIIQFGRDVIPFMLDLRFLSHFLRQLGHVPFREFCHDVLAHGLIVHEGKKMSKHLGNAVTPEEMIRSFGADALRFYVLARAEPKSDFRWSDEGIRRYHAVLSSYFDVIRGSVREHRAGQRVGDQVGENTLPGPPTFGRYTSIFLKKVVREVSTLETSVDVGRYDRYAGALERLISAMSFFATNHLGREHHPRFAPMWSVILEQSVFYLAPVAPHLAEECWELLGHADSVFADARFAAGKPAPLEELLMMKGDAVTQREDGSPAKSEDAPTTSGPAVPSTKRENAPSMKAQARP